MTTHSSIHTNVMHRVRTIHTLRPLLSEAMLAFVLFAVALYGIGREVWVAKIIANMPSATNVAALTRFMVAAFLNTHFIVQALTVLALAAFVWLAHEMARTLTPQRAFRG